MTERLKELLEASGCTDDDGHAVLQYAHAECSACVADTDLQNAAPDLARLVVTLTEALAEKTHDGRTVGAGHPTPCKSCAALAAVEELRL